MFDRHPHAPALSLGSALGSAVVLTLLLTGCVPGDDQPTPSSTPSSTGSPEASPQPSGEPTASPTVVPAVIPASCENTVGEEIYSSTFAGQTLNDPGYGQPAGVLVPSAAGEGAAPREVIVAATELFCIWGDSSADITQLYMGFSRADPVVAAEYLADLAEEGYTCEQILGGERCQRIRPNEQYPVEEAETAFSREGIVIRIYQANFPTNDLLGSVVERVWG